MSDLLNSLNEKPKKQLPCAFRSVVGCVTPEEWAKLEQIVEEMRSAKVGGAPSGYTAVWLAQVLNDHDVVISPTSINRHIKRRCSCG